MDIAISNKVSTATWLHLVAITLLFLLSSFVFFDLTDLTEFSLAYWLHVIVMFCYLIDGNRISTFFIPTQDNELAHFWALSCLGIWVNIVPLSLNEIPVSNYTVVWLLFGFGASMSFVTGLEKHFSETRPLAHTGIFVIARQTVIWSYILLFGWVINSGEWNWYLSGLDDLLFLFHDKYVAY